MDLVDLTDDDVDMSSSSGDSKEAKQAHAAESDVPALVQLELNEIRRLTAQHETAIGKLEAEIRSHRGEMAKLKQQEQKALSKLAEHNLSFGGAVSNSGASSSSSKQAPSRASTVPPEFASTAKFSWNAEVDRVKSEVFGIKEFRLHQRGSFIHVIGSALNAAPQRLSTSRCQSATALVRESNRPMVRTPCFVQL